MASAPPVSTSLSFQLNGERAEVRGETAQTTLLDYLRSRGLTGAKEGCAEGECGSCTVVMVRPCREGSAYKPVNSCLMFLPMAAGHEIYTVEALARGGRLHPVQRAMAKAGGSQCGYCTPGFVMSLFAEQYRPGRSGPCSTAALGGNLCRCTGYRPIREAALSLDAAPPEFAPDDEFGKRLTMPAPVPDAFQSATFSRPSSIAECLSILAEAPHARLVAGATDLAVESNLKGKRFGALVSVELLPELRVFEEAPDFVEFGAALSLDEIGALWRDAPPFFGRWLELFASPPLRNRATLGGNLATASPIGDSAPLLLALDAEVRIAGRSGFRSVPLHAFFTGYRQTALQPGELLAAIRIPKPLPRIVRFYKLAKRRLDDISTVAAGFALNLDRAGRVEMARLAYGGVAAVPTRARAAEACLIGGQWDLAAVSRAQAAVEHELSPIGDHRGSAAYRLAMARSLIAKFQHETAQGRLGPSEPSGTREASEGHDLLQARSVVRASPQKTQGDV
jgi:xanthine dehydrogenase small subunit